MVLLSRRAWNQTGRRRTLFRLVNFCATLIRHAGRTWPHPDLRATPPPKRTIAVGMVLATIRRGLVPRTGLSALPETACPTARSATVNLAPVAAPTQAEKLATLATTLLNLRFFGLYARLPPQKLDPDTGVDDYYERRSRGGIVRRLRVVGGTPNGTRGLTFSS